MKRNIRRITAILLIVGVLASVTCLLNVLAGDNAAVKNYPILRGYTEGTAPSNGVWSYNLTDYGAKPAFNRSTAGFENPTADFDANNAVTDFSWTAFDGASSYSLKIALGSSTVQTEENILSTEFSTPSLIGGNTYEIQITARGADGKAIAYSDVCRFTAEDGSENLESYSFDPYSADIIAADKYFSSSKLVTDASSRKVGYLIKNTGFRRVVYRAMASGSERMGAYTVFTAPKPDDESESITYDIAASFAVVDNKNVTDARAYFRILKIDNNGGISVISPYDTSVSDWYTIDVTSENKNPKAEIYAPQASLKEGERVVIEAYADTPENTALDILIGNPTATPIQTTSDYKGEIAVYPLNSYVPHYIYYDNGYQTIANKSLHRTYVDGLHRLSKMITARFPIWISLSLTAIIWKLPRI